MQAAVENPIEPSKRKPSGVAASMSPTASPTPFWNVPGDALLAQNHSSLQGLDEAEAQRRMQASTNLRLGGRRQTPSLVLMLGQFKSPIILLLIFAAGLSLFLGEHTEAGIIFLIVFVSGLLGFWQEHGAANAVAKLLLVVQTKTNVRRDGKTQEVTQDNIVAGDIVLLSAGDVIPGDCVVLESNVLSVDEAALTGETFPAEKSPAPVAIDAPLSHRANCLYMGTHVVSGTATALVIHTGTQTQFGSLSEKLRARPPETEFEHGVRRFGYMLMELTLLLVIAVFATNVYLHKPVLESFLFALALAVGLTPQLLPVIISVNLAHGARKMAAQKVIVKRLASIENFGSMDVLCSDKTGTLTESEVVLRSALDADGADSGRALLFATLNATFQTGYANPIDQAIRAHGQIDLTAWRKTGEVPYDFTRKRLSVLAEQAGQTGQKTQGFIITKGALTNILAVCTRAESAQGVVSDIHPLREQIQQKYEAFSGQGLRTLGIAYRGLPSGTDDANGIKTKGRVADEKTADGKTVMPGKEGEADMTFLGFLVLEAPLKAGIVEAIARLQKLGVALKIITGDNALVAASISRQAGIAAPELLTGGEIAHMSNAALIQRARRVHVFAEVEPNQKEHIITALRKAGHVVGYMGDGINDVSALHAADVSLSVAEAVDVAKEAADIVLLEKDLGVLEKGVREGRTTFANTLKYVSMATSANFGNMFSMAGASLFLPFLPLLPTQVLLTNLITDFPEMTIAGDSVDAEMVDMPRRWDVKFIVRYMVVFGLVSSVFDYLTFGVLLLGLHASPAQFRTGWFVESVVTASLIVLVIRTRRPFFRSKPSPALLCTTLLAVAAVLILPYLPLGHLFGLVPLTPMFLAALAVIMLFYVAATEIAKWFFYRNMRPIGSRSR